MVSQNTLFVVVHAGSICQGRHCCEVELGRVAGLFIARGRTVSEQRHFQLKDSQSWHQQERVFFSDDQKNKKTGVFLVSSEAEATSEPPSVAYSTRSWGNLSSESLWRSRGESYRVGGFGGSGGAAADRYSTMMCASGRMRRCWFQPPLQSRQALRTRHALGAI